VLFIALTLGPGCIFFLYVLCQFWREAHRPGGRHMRPAKSAVLLFSGPVGHSDGSQRGAAPGVVPFERNHSTQRGVA
jgi:hypothetical protein